MLEPPKHILLTDMDNYAHNHNQSPYKCNSLIDNMNTRLHVYYTHLTYLFIYIRCAHVLNNGVTIGTLTIPIILLVIEV